MSGASLELRDVDLLLIGKTGTGKSSTGNSILGRPCFISLSSMSSVTKHVDIHFAERYRYGVRVKVIDTPGFIDTDEKDKTLDMEKARENIAMAISMCRRGINALLFVISFGEKATRENLEVVQMLGRIFGPQLLINHLIIIVTKGDTFDAQMEDETNTRSFEEWCQAQEGDMKTFFEICQNRCILFYNLKKHQTERENALQKLFNMVDEITKKSNVYTHEHFEEARKLREASIADEGIPQFSLDILEKIKLLEADIEIYGGRASDADLKRLSRRYQELSDEIRRMGKKKLNFPSEFKSRVRAIAKSISELEELMKQRKKMSLAQFQPKKEAIVKKMKEDVTVIVMTTPPSSIWSSLARYGGKALLGAAVVGAGVVTGGLALGPAGAVAGFGAGAVGTLAAGASDHTVDVNHTASFNSITISCMRDVRDRTNRLQIRSSDDSESDDS